MDDVHAFPSHQAGNLKDKTGVVAPPALYDPVGDIHSTQLPFVQSTGKAAHLMIETGMIEDCQRFDQQPLDSAPTQIGCDVHDLKWLFHYYSLYGCSIMYTS